MNERNRRILIAVLVIAFIGIFSYLVANRGQFGLTTLFQAGAPAPVSGTLYYDANANGQQDAGEVGIPNVQITAFDQEGNVQNPDGAGQSWTTDTDADGNFSFSIPSGNIRIEYGALPAGYAPGIQAAGSAPKVAFVNNESGDPSVSFGVVRPAEFCDQNPDLALTCFSNGDPIATASANGDPAIVALPYSAQNSQVDDSLHRMLASAEQVGAVWGLAYDGASNSYFSSAVLKRHSGFGPLGIGGIYRVTDPNGTPGVESWLDVTTLGVNVGTDDRSGTCGQGGVAVDDPNCLPASLTEPSYDQAAFGNIGKKGIGGIDVSDDGKTLWVMSLASGELVGIDIATKQIAEFGNGNPARVNVVANNPTPSACGAATLRPWAVEYRDGRVYVGAVCDGSNGGELNARILSVNLLNGALGDQTGTLSLTYDRGNIEGNVSGDWNSWDTPTDWAGNVVYNPQPILSDIEFDGDDAIVLGFTDRNGHQTGYRNYAPDPGTDPGPDGTSEGLNSGRNAGDILRVCNGSLESNGECGGVTTAGQGNFQGPGNTNFNGEYYFRDTGWGYNDVDGDGTLDPIPDDHEEDTMGGLAILPGSNQVVSTLGDPVNPEINGAANPISSSAGLVWFNNLDGANGAAGSDGPDNQPNANDKRHLVYSSYNTQNGTFGKASGLGDLEVACEAAPVEVGNRIWHDLDENGLQEPGEPVLSNVQVELWEMQPDGVNGTVLASTTTDANGLYKFTDADVGGFTVGGDYQVRVTSSNFAAGGALENFYPTRVDADSNGGTTNAQDEYDSDGQGAGGQNYAASFQIVGGQNNHSYDFGFVEYAEVGDFVWLDADEDGIQDAGEAGIPDVDVFLYKKQNNGSYAQFGAMQSTDANGKYLFTEVVPGQYVVGFSLSSVPSGYVQTQTNVGGNDEIDSDPEASYLLNDNIQITAEFTVLGGTSDLTWDAGFYEPAGPVGSIGDLVWIDENGDGGYNIGPSPEPGEPGQSGVVVELFTSDGQSTGRTETTGSDGKYLFTNVPYGEYYVVFDPTTIPDGYSFTLEDATGNNVTDSDPDASGSILPEIITINDQNQNDITWDAGLVQNPEPVLGSIGDYVWLDANYDGVQQRAESPVSNVTVELYDEADTQNSIATDVTDEFGFYLFDQLPAGNYIVKFVKPSGYEFTVQNASTTNDGQDSDVDVETGFTDTISLAEGEDTVLWDAGLVELSSIGDFVWEDLNADGIQDDGEPGISNVTVNLLDSTGQQLDTTTTDGAGVYGFFGLYPDEYIVEFVAPSGYVATVQNVAGDDSIDSDADRTTLRTTTIILPAGVDDPTWDLGLFRLAALGDKAWLDSDQDGLQTLQLGGGGISLNDVGVPDVDVYLVDASTGDDIAFTTTDQDGEYLFSNLYPGEYQLYFHLPSGVNYVFTLPNQGNLSADFRDSDAVPTQFALNIGVTANIPLASGQTDLTWDAGMYDGTQPEPAEIGDYVWFDDGDGIQEDGEAPVEGFTVHLYQQLGRGFQRIATEQTDANGLYLFTGLSAGQYRVFFDKAGDFSAYEFTQRDATPVDSKTADEVDSDAYLTDDQVAGIPAGFTETISLEAGEVDHTWDAGLLAEPASLGDYVWEDLDGDGLQGQDESGINGVEVDLVDPFSVDLGNPTILAKTTTYTEEGKGAGYYEFNGLNPGTYIVRVQVPNGYTPTQRDADGSIGDNSTNVDSDIDTAEATLGYMYATTLVSGENDPSWDAGLIVDEPPVVERYSIGDYVWEDSNQDGIQDDSENPIEGVTVSLYAGLDGRFFRGSTTTDADGLYRFDNLEPRDYIVQFETPDGYVLTTPDQGSDDAVDSDVQLDTGRSHIVTIVDADDFTIDAGMYQPVIEEDPAAIGDYVWVDTDEDGVQDDDEAGLENVTVQLAECEGDVISVQTTDADGGYLFSNVAPGTYEIRFIEPDGYDFTDQNQGGDDALDSDADPTTGVAECVTLAAGQTDLTWDAGLVEVVEPPGEEDEPGEIGDQVWVDEDGDGIQDENEPGLEGVEVELRLCIDNALVAVTRTGEDGLYLFSNLNPGEYYIRFIRPAEYEFSPMNQGDDFAVDSDPNPETGVANCTRIDAGESDLKWDAGLIPVVSVPPVVTPDPDPAVQVEPTPSVKILPETGSSTSILILSIIAIVGGIVLVGWGVRLRRL